MEAEATTTMLDGWRALERRGTVDSVTAHGAVETWHWHTDAYDYRCVWTSAGTPAAEIAPALDAAWTFVCATASPDRRWLETVWARPTAARTASVRLAA